MYGPVAQLVEQRIENPRVGGSIPPQATKLKSTDCASAQSVFLCGPQWRAASPHDSCVRPAIRRIASAGSGFQAFAIEHCHVTTVIADQPIAPQCARCRSDSHPSNAEHVGQKFMRDTKTVRGCSVLAHQEPTGQSWLHGVKAHTGGRYSELSHQHMEITKDRALQRRALAQLGAKGASIDPQGRPGTLYQRVQRLRSHAERQMRTQHAFLSDHSDLDALVPIDDGHQRDKALRRKVNVTRGRFGFAKDFGQYQRVRFADCDEPGTGGARQPLDHLIRRSGQEGFRLLAPPKGGGASSCRPCRECRFEANGQYEAGR